MNEYAILSFLQEIPKKTIQGELPLHVTFLRPFYTTKNDDYFISIIKTIPEGRHQMSLRANSEKMFGENEDVPVVELESTSELQELHKELLDACKNSIEFKNDQYPEYRPHVTNTREKKISVGENILINSISLAKIQDENREIIFTLNLR